MFMPFGAGLGITMMDGIKYSRRDFITMAGAGVLSTMLGCAVSAAKNSKTQKPNFIFIYADDLGYGDLACYGSTKNRTPHIDKMADEGMRFTDFYVTSGVCTPSRSSLMTGCYPRRVNLHVDSNDKWVLFPNAKKGLHPDEITVAEVLKM